MRSTMLCLVILLLLVAGCSRNDRSVPSALTAPRPPVALQQDAASRLASGVEWGQGFYPMHVGNRWRYASRDSEAFFNPNGTVITRRTQGKIEIVQLRMEQKNGRMYMREEIGIPDTVLLGGGVRWRREDRTGLYEYGTPAPRGSARSS